MAFRIHAASRAGLFEDSLLYGRFDILSIFGDIGFRSIAVAVDWSEIQCLLF
jgi:hypothetical protein